MRSVGNGHPTGAVLLAIWAVVTALNLTKAVHIDDTGYLLIVRHILKQPLHPMSGLIHWGDHEAPIYSVNQPDLLPYIYALTMLAVGERELALHLVMSAFSLVAVVCFYFTAASVDRKAAGALTAAFCLG